MTKRDRELEKTRWTFAQGEREFDLRREAPRRLCRALGLERVPDIVLRQRDRPGPEPRLPDREDSTVTERERREIRRRVIAHALQQVAMGAAGISPGWLRAALENRRDLLDQVAADLPGRVTVLSECWEGLDRDLFTLRLAYVDGDAATSPVAVVASDSDAVAEGEHADLVWMSRQDVNVLWLATVPRPQSEGICLTEDGDEA